MTDIDHNQVAIIKKNYGDKEYVSRVLLPSTGSQMSSMKKGALEYNAFQR